MSARLVDVNHVNNTSNQAMQITKLDYSYVPCYDRFEAIKRCFYDEIRHRMETKLRGRVVSSSVAAGTGGMNMEEGEGASSAASSPVAAGAVPIVPVHVGMGR